jgi:hypothetical protein
MKNSDLPHSCPMLFLSSQVLVQSLKGIDHLSTQCAWRRFGQEMCKRNEAKRLSQSSEFGSYIKVRKYPDLNLRSGNTPTLIAVVHTRDMHYSQLNYAPAVGATASPSSFLAFFLSGA